MAEIDSTHEALALSAFDAWIRTHEDDHGALDDASANAGFMAAWRHQAERIAQLDAANKEWHDKTDWLQKDIKPKELGKHRADVLRERVEALEVDLQFIERWAVHHGTKPSFSAEEALSVIQHYPAIREITKSYADGKYPNTFNPYDRIAQLEADNASLRGINSDQDKSLAQLEAQALRGGHSVPCLYQYALARLGIDDSPQMRVLFWDAHEALDWDKSKDWYIQPEISSDCAECDAARAAKG